MNKKLQLAFETEMICAYRALEGGRLDHAMKHFERAHVLGQKYVMPHVKSHWGMLRVGLKRSSFKEVWGQAVRILIGALGSAVGVVPLGNTGGTDISMFARLPVPEDVMRLERE